jgi:hypothetical protein
MMISSGKMNQLAEELRKCHFVHSKCHVKAPGTEPQASRSEAIAYDNRTVNLTLSAIKIVINRRALQSRIHWFLSLST